ncbi:MAG: hypothetical protein ACYTG5_01075 [Planctomycetota bacterium]|jgi:hypothetical protein
MLPRSCIFAAVLSCCLSSASLLPAQQPASDASNAELTGGDLAIWADWLRPSEEDAAWLKSIPWQPSFAEGIRRANEDAKPLLLWVMNGHPLGCT